MRQKTSCPCGAAEPCAKNDGVRNCPATDVELARLKRYRTAGTSPGNPKWYKAHNIVPFVFKAGQPPVYPRLPSGAAWRIAHCTGHRPAPDPYRAAAEHDTVPEYVAAYNAAAGLRT